MRLPPTLGFAANLASPELFHFACISKRFTLCRITASTSFNTHQSLEIKKNYFLDLATLMNHTTYLPTVKKQIILSLLWLNPADS